LKNGRAFAVKYKQFGAVESGHQTSARLQQSDGLNPAREPCDLNSAAEINAAGWQRQARNANGHGGWLAVKEHHQVHNVVVVN
jgi:hypothetical protein